ncbi:MAG: hypothetical protein PHC88_06745 [Terrimicrobiaceae bacterium]|nr:hypothetical protein [Terrimicrobiaceae bacterium]
MLTGVAILALCLLAGLAFLAMDLGISAKPASGPTSASAHSAGWGIDACLSVFAPTDLLPAWIRTLESAHLTYLRERNPRMDDPRSWTEGPIAAYRTLAAAGHKIVAIAELPSGPKPEQGWNALPEDLIGVYWSSYALSRRLAGIVSVWELPNEPDTLYCSDLPDRLAAYCKAAYLGLKDGAACARAGLKAGKPATEGVLMSALGNFPGPWLARAAENGLFDYTDGLNMHFYGHARDLRGAIRAQRAFAAQWTWDRTLPIWITECGINAVPMDEVAEARGREIQRQFVLETARAAIDERVAVFMPFVLTWPKEEWFAFLRGPAEPYPAWEAYARFTREYALPVRLRFSPPRNPARIVLQWIPDNRTCIPSKVGGSYWFRGTADERRSIKSELAVYNFSGAPATGALEIEHSDGVAIASGGPAWTGRSVTVPPFGAVRIPLEIRAAGSGYRREPLRFRFSSAGRPESRAVVWVETRPEETILPRRFDVVASRPQAGGFTWIWEPEPIASSQAGGPWLGLNGVELAGAPDGTAGALGAPTLFRIHEHTGDPRLPPMAVTKINGLPPAPQGFLRLRFPEAPQAGVRVDLVDDRGQRFSVAENLGRNPIRDDPREVLLAYGDFHIYAWGRCTGQPVFRPEAIREIQLRFYPVLQPAELTLSLDALAPAIDPSAR